MRTFFGLVTGILAFFLLSTSSLAQGMPDIPESAPLIRERSEFEKYLAELKTSRDSPPVREDRVLKKGWLAPSEAERLAFTGFLRLRNTGLIRLLPRESFDSDGNYRAKPEKIRGGGSYYSFANLTHVYGYGSDIGLEQNHLSVGFAGASFGMLTNLGDVSIEEITLKDARAQFLSGYEPPVSEAEARAEARRFPVRGGVAIDGLVYQRRVPVQEHATYLLRSIDYDRSDLLVAFRMVKKDSNGSVTLAWKLLKQYSVPRLSRR